MHCMLKERGREELGLLFVIPTLNEEAGIGLVLDSIDEVMRGIGCSYKVLVVDGGSTDRTVDIALEKGAEVVFQKGKGYGDAYIYGFSLALKHFRPRVLVMIDGDYTYCLGDLPNMLAALEEQGADMVIGNRFGGMLPGAMSRVNRFGNMVLSWLSRVMIGVNVRDSQSGFRVVRREIVETVPLRLRGMPFATELLVEAYAYGFKIVEVPVCYRPRIGGRTKLKPFRDGAKILAAILGFAAAYNPAFFVFGVSALFLVPSLFMSLYVASSYFYGGVERYFEKLVATVLAFAGFQSLFMAVLSLYVKKMEYRLAGIVRSRRRGWNGVEEPKGVH